MRWRGNGLISVLTAAKSKHVSRCLCRCSWRTCSWLDVAQDMAERKAKARMLYVLLLRLLDS